MPFTRGNNNGTSEKKPKTTWKGLIVSLGFNIFAMRMLLQHPAFGWRWNCFDPWIVCTVQVGWFPCSVVEFISNRLISHFNSMTPYWMFVERNIFVCDFQCVLQSMGAHPFQCFVMAMIQLTEWNQLSEWVCIWLANELSTLALTQNEKEPEHTSLSFGMSKQKYCLKQWTCNANPIRCEMPATQSNRLKKRVQTELFVCTIFIYWNNAVGAICIAFVMLVMPVFPQPIPFHIPCCVFVAIELIRPDDIDEIIIFN